MIVFEKTVNPKKLSNKLILKFGFTSLTFFFSLLFISSCQKDEEILALKKIILTDIAYGNHPLQKLDIYLPAGRSVDTPVMFCIHGGSWTGGDKVDLASIADYFSSRGIATVNLNYRLTNDSTNYVQLNEDINSAIQFIRSSVKDHYLSNNKFVVFGQSSGAQLGLLHEFQNNSSGLIKAVVSLAGPCDLTNPYYSQSLMTSGIQSYTGVDSSGVDLIWKNSSPVCFLSKNSPPVYLLYVTQGDYVDL